MLSTCFTPARGTAMLREPAKTSNGKSPAKSFGAHLNFCAAPCVREGAMEKSRVKRTSLGVIKSGWTRETLENPDFAFGIECTAWNSLPGKSDALLRCIRKSTFLFRVLCSKPVLLQNPG